MWYHLNNLHRKLPIRMPSGNVADGSAVEKMAGSLLGILFGDIGGRVIAG
jgi:hypothetical protein